MSVYVELRLKIDDGFWFSTAEAEETSDESILDIISEEPLEFWEQATKKVIRNAD